MIRVVRDQPAISDLLVQATGASPLAAGQLREVRQTRIPKISQETRAEIVGTTRSSVILHD